MAENGGQYKINNKKRKKGRSVIDIIEGVKPVTDEIKRFEMILYSKDTLAMVLGDPWASSEARKLLTGNNLLMFNAAAETNTQKRYRMVLEKLCELTVSQFAASAVIFPTMEYTMLVRDRCELCKDTAACKMYDKIINGDSDSEIEEEMLGLLGLWKLQDNRTAGAILVAVGKITQEEFQGEIDARDTAERSERETVHGCSLCGGVFPESKCVKVKINNHEEWICKADYETLKTEGKVEAVPLEKPVEKPVEKPPAVKPTVPEVKIEKEIPPQPPKEKEKNDRLSLMRQEIEERIAKKKKEMQSGEKKVKEETPVIIKSTAPIDIPMNMIAEGEGQEPQDYTQYTYGDFEALIKNMDNVDDLEDVYEYIDLSKVLNDDERERLYALVEQAKSNLEKGG